MRNNQKKFSGEDGEGFLIGKHEIKGSHFEDQTSDGPDVQANNLLYESRNEDLRVRVDTLSERQMLVKAESVEGS